MLRPVAGLRSHRHPRGRRGRCVQSVVPEHRRRVLQEIWTWLGGGDAIRPQVCLSLEGQGLTGLSLISGLTGDALVTSF